MNLYTVTRVMIMMLSMMAFSIASSCNLIKFDTEEELLELTRNVEEFRKTHAGEWYLYIIGVMSRSALINNVRNGSSDMMRAYYENPERFVLELRITLEKLKKYQILLDDLETTGEISGNFERILELIYECTALDEPNNTNVPINAQSNMTSQCCNKLNSHNVCNSLL